MADPVVLDSKYGVQVWSAHDTHGRAGFWVVDRRRQQRRFGTKVRFDTEREALKHAYSLIMRYSQTV